jgi:NAD(P)-dependent dehydrogenase (short-subunit alcohol dehydrogenase family)
MLLDGGARVVVTGRSKAGLESAQKELGKGAAVVSSDARSLTDIDALASKVKTEFDTFDLLFVNARLSTRAPLASLTEAIYDEMFNLNAKGPLFAVQKLAPLNRSGNSASFPLAFRAASLRLTGSTLMRVSSAPYGSKPRQKADITSEC